MSELQTTISPLASLRTNQSEQNKLAISIENVTLGFGDKTILQDIHWGIERGTMATLIGPNGCGKSTLLKAITGTNKLVTGRIVINGKELSTYKKSELASYMAFLPQSPEVPKDMTVEELVYCGRYPYQKWWRNSASEDRLIVERSMEQTRVLHLRNRLVASLSGGERQRVWIAMALSQEPKVLLLDEPTTYLDINHQLEVLELLKELNKSQGLTVVMVLHDLNQAVQYSKELAVLWQAKLIDSGAPRDIMKAELVQQVFSVRSTIEETDDKVLSVRIDGLVKKVADT